MSKKTIILVVCLIALLCLGMWRFAVLWLSEQKTAQPSQVTDVATALPDIPRFWLMDQVTLQKPVPLVS